MTGTDEASRIRRACERAGVRYGKWEVSPYGDRDETFEGRCEGVIVSTIGVRAELVLDLISDLPATVRRVQGRDLRRVQALGFDHNVVTVRGQGDLEPAWTAERLLTRPGPGPVVGVYASDAVADVPEARERLLRLTARVEARGGERVTARQGRFGRMTLDWQHPFSVRGHVSGMREEALSARIDEVCEGAPQLAPIVESSPDHTWVTLSWSEPTGRSGLPEHPWGVSGLGSGRDRETAICKAFGRLGKEVERKRRGARRYRALLSLSGYFESHPDFLPHPEGCHLWTLVRAGSGSLSQSIVWGKERLAEAGCTRSSVIHLPQTRGGPDFTEGPLALVFGQLGDVPLRSDVPAAPTSTSPWYADRVDEVCRLIAEWSPGPRLVLDYSQPNEPRAAEDVAREGWDRWEEASWAASYYLQQGHDSFGSDGDHAIGDDFAALFDDYLNGQQEF